MSSNAVSLYLTSVVNKETPWFKNNLCEQTALVYLRLVYHFKISSSLLKLNLSRAAAQPIVDLKYVSLNLLRNFLEIVHYYLVTWIIFNNVYGNVGILRKLLYKAWMKGKSHFKLVNCLFPTTKLQIIHFTNLYLPLLWLNCTII